LDIDSWSREHPTSPEFEIIKEDPEPEGKNIYKNSKRNGDIANKLESKLRRKSKPLHGKSYGAATNSTSPAKWSTVVSDPAYYTAYNEHYDLPPPRHNDASSCRDVADAIRYIRPGVGGELESEMGCADGNDCEIPTTRAFDLMDRFSSEDLGGSRQ
ncbi:hypothetical protein HII31_01932, partial [Pseudocercospora fuligena]